MKRKHKILHKIFVFIITCFTLAVCFVLAAGIILCLDYMRRYIDVQHQNSNKGINRYWEVTVSADSFSESAAALSNPDRGIYQMYGFLITDKDVDYNTIVADNFRYDRYNTITMIQINLRNYNRGEISERGLEHIAKLFDALRTVTGKRLLVRFLYDWDGKNLDTEPKSLDIILNHIRQLEPILRDNHDQIFILQGLFLGNNGEMHHSKYTTNDNYMLLADTLASVTDDSTFLAVRTPAQWRATTRLADITADLLISHPYAWRFSLFNDGMMGTSLDTGTYGSQSRAEAGDFTLWNREEELEFQNQLCCYVPNGGEVIINNVYNDFENALPTMRQMRITYINEDYDKNVLNKWAQTVINDGSVYDGMDGYTYIKRHLGYRLLIDSTDIAYHAETKSLSVRIDMRNTGFAPLYGSKEGRLILHHAENDAYYIYPFEEDITALSRTGSEADIFTLQQLLQLSKLPEGTYTASFQLWDNDTASQLQLAIETPQTNVGYRLGSFAFIEHEEHEEPVKYPELPNLPFGLDSRIEEILHPSSDEPTNKLWQWLDRLYPQE